MSDSIDNIGVLNLSGICAEELNLKQIYSPSRLYSVIIPKKIITGLSMKEEICILNNATKTVKKYSVKASGSSETQLKVNYLYWFADFLLVAVIQGEQEITQVIFTVDHVANNIVQDRERKFEVPPNMLQISQQNIFMLHVPTIFIQGRDYIVWYGNIDFDDRHYCIFLLPKNPLANVSIKQFALKWSSDTSIIDEIENLITLNVNEFVHFSVPEFSNSSQLLCRIKVSNNLDSASSELFGVFVAYDATKLIDIYGKEDHDQLEIDYIHESATSLTFLPKLSSLSSEDFIILHKYKSTYLENRYLMMKPLKNTIELRMINFDTMEHQYKIISREKFNSISLHPDGIILLWNKTARGIEYKKVIFNWKSDSLLDISRKSLILNEKYNPLEIDGLQPILFPGSEIILKSDFQKTADDSVKSHLPPFFLTIPFASWLFNIFSR